MAASVEIRLEDFSNNNNIIEDANNNEKLPNSSAEESPEITLSGGSVEIKELESTLPRGAEGGAGRSSEASVNTTTLSLPTQNGFAGPPSRRSSLTASASFTETQLAEFRASFDECDKGKTGFISVGDLESVVRTLGLSLGPEAIREMIDKFDLKRSGEIDFDEFVEMMAVTTRGAAASEEEEIRQIFTVRMRHVCVVLFVFF